MLRVLIVDELVVSCKKTLLALNQKFECITQTSPIAAIETVSRFKPDIILLDINTPEMNGFETCEKLVTLECGKRPVVVFVSAKNDLKTRIKAYDAGGHDYIAAPFSTEELIRKLERIGGLIQEREDLKHNMEDSQTLAITSMKQASHYGYIMNFYKNLYHCASITEVAALFFEAMTYWELKASLVIRLDKWQYFESAHQDTISPIERKIFVALSEAGRLYEFGSRLLVNDKHCSFLVKNMPKDAAYAGEVRDIVAAIIEGLEAKAIDLKRQKGLELVTKELNSTIRNVQTGVETHNQLISSVITDMVGAVSSSFHSLDLTEEQEAFFHDLFEKSGRKIMTVEQVLLDIQEQLYLLSNQVEQIIEDTKEVKKTIAKTNTELELF